MQTFVIFPACEIKKMNEFKEILAYIKSDLHEVLWNTTVNVSRGMAVYEIAVLVVHCLLAVVLASCYRMFS
jgi:hypothetical protein